MTIFITNWVKTKSEKVVPILWWLLVNLDLTTIWIVQQICKTAANVADGLTFFGSLLFPLSRLKSESAQGKNLGSVMYDKVRWKFNKKRCCCFTAATKDSG